MKHSLPSTAFLLLGVVLWTPAHGATISITQGPADEQKAAEPATTEDIDKLKKFIESLKKPVSKKEATEPKKNKVSFSTGYSNAQATDKRSSGNSASISLSRQLSRTGTAYGFAFGSLSESYSAGNDFDGESFGLGAGYAHVIESGFILNGSFTLSRSDTDGLVTQGISASHSLLGKLSFGVSKPYVINNQDVVTPSLSLSQTVQSHGKPTFRLSPKVTYARQFSPKWRGNVSVGGSGSHKNITLSGRKAYVDLGLGASYLISDDISAGVSYTRTESTGGHHGNNASFSVSTPF